MKIVVKLGGEVARSAEIAAIAGDIVGLRADGHDVIVVHGGGPQVTELQKKLGQVPKVIAGRRITDDAALDVLTMVVAGTVNVDICRALLRAGGTPVGLHGASSLVVEARRRPPVVVRGAGPEPIDFGNVGDVVGVRVDLLDRLLTGGYTPVIACLGADALGGVYNINADVVASAIAQRTRSDALVLVTDVPGVLRDAGDPGSRFTTLSRAELEQHEAEGRITRGMIPKLSEGFAALQAGIRYVHVVGRLDAGELRGAVEHPGSVGTALVVASPQTPRFD